MNAEAIQQLTGRSPNALYSHFQRNWRGSKYIKYHYWKNLLHIAHSTWWTASHLIKLSLTLQSGESWVFCWAPQFVSSKCFSVKKQQRFLHSCIGKMFYSITLNIQRHNKTLYIWHVKYKKTPVDLCGLTLLNCELSLLHIIPVDF